MAKEWVVTARPIRFLYQVGLVILLGYLYGQGAMVVGALLCFDIELKK